MSPFNVVNGLVVCSITTISKQLESKNSVFAPYGVLAASQAEEAALESTVVSQGLLTFALIREGLVERSADENADSRITVSEWLRYGRERVPDLAEEVRRGEVTRFGPRGVWVVSFGDEKASPFAKKHLLQQPVLFDFAKGRSEFVLSEPLGH